MNTEAATQPLEDLQETLDSINHLKYQIEEATFWVKSYVFQLETCTEGILVYESISELLMEKQEDLAAFKKKLKKELSDLAHLSGQVQRLLSPVEEVNGEYKAVVLCSPTK